MKYYIAEYKEKYNGFYRRWINLKGQIVGKSDFIPKKLDVEKLKNTKYLLSDKGTLKFEIKNIIIKKDRVIVEFLEPTKVIKEAIINEK